VREHPSFIAFVVLTALTLVSSARAQSPPLELRKGDHIVFLGNTMAERLQQFNYFETMLMARFPDLDSINVMRLHSADTAILSAVIFNALIIVALIPLALRGVKFRVGGAAEVLRRNLLIYGVGGIVAPFIGIKLIDLVITALGVN